MDDHSPPPPPRARPWPDDHVLAEEIGRPGGGQAVANVLRAAPDLPWWRVIPADGRVYRTHAPTQAPLLAAEGHRIDEHRRVHPRGT